MSKSIRVYELARELNVESKRLLKILNEDLNIEVSNHMSTINDRVAARLRQIIRDADRPETDAQQSTVIEKAASADKKKTAVPKQEKPAERSTSQAARPAAEEARQQTSERTKKGRTSRAGTAATEDRKSTRQGADRATPESTGSVEREASATSAKGKKRTEAANERQPRGRQQRGNDWRNAQRNRGKRNRKGKAKAKPSYQIPAEVVITGPVTVGELSAMLKVPVAETIKKLMSMGMMVTVNEKLDPDVAGIVVEEFGAAVKLNLPEVQLSDEELLARTMQEDKEQGETKRPPVVTILGHVDHGKTSLLDAIRKTKTAGQEAGGITQHIGASVVHRNGRPIVFLDTPGHEAFTAMRARGAKVTDIAVLVVAADDGVMPQTVEAINHAKAAELPIIVAINKIDRPDAQPERVMQQLTEHELIPEEWGGDTIFVQVSAIKGEGIDQLLEMILLLADILELQASAERAGVGTVIEARLERSRGPVATVLVQSGTVRLGDAFVAGTTYGKIRAMLDDDGNAMKEAGPSIPVEILGFNDVPNAGDIFRVVEDERQARELATERQQEAREEDMAARRGATLTEFYRRMQEGDEKELKLILKADVQGSLEALRSSLEKLHNEEARVTIIHTGVGGINESDVMLASAGGAIVIGFNVRPSNGAMQLAAREQVEIKTYRVIYDIISDVEAALRGLLEPVFEEVILGRAEVRATFRVPNIGTVAGLYVTEGKVTRNAQVRVIRDGVVVHEGNIDSLKRFQDDVREVSAGYECGLSVERFNDVKNGDIIEVFAQQEVER